MAVGRNGRLRHAPVMRRSRTRSARWRSLGSGIEKESQATLDTAMGSLRYEVAIEGANEGGRSVYTVASQHGVHKAVAMAATAHVAKERHHRIFRVEVRELDGSSLLRTDLVDRMEW